MLGELDEVERILEQLHRVVAHGADHAGVEDGHDLRVLDVALHLDLALEAHLVELGRCADEHFERDVAIGGGVVAGVDAPHASAGEHALDFVASDAITDAEGSRVDDGQRAGRAALARGPRLRVGIASLAPTLGGLGLSNRCVRRAPGGNRAQAGTLPLHDERGFAAAAAGGLTLVALGDGAGRHLETPAAGGTGDADLFLAHVDSPDLRGAEHTG